MGANRNSREPARPKKTLESTFDRPVVQKEVSKGPPEQRARAHYSKLLKLLSNHQLVIVAPSEEVCSARKNSRACVCAQVGSLPICCRYVGLRLPSSRSSLHDMHRVGGLLELLKS